MTAIVGITDGLKAHLGADSGSFRGWDRHIVPGGKLFTVGGAVVGLAGYAVDGQIIRHFVAVADPEPGDDIEQWAVRILVPALRDALKARGRVTVKDAVETWDSECLVAIRDRILRVGQNFHVAQRDDGLYAIGCGADFALGALHATEGESRARLHAALRAAEYYSAGVAAPFTFASTEAA